MIRYGVASWEASNHRTPEGDMYIDYETARQPWVFCIVGLLGALCACVFLPRDDNPLFAFGCWHRQRSMKKMLFLETLVAPQMRLRFRSRKLSERMTEIGRHINRALTQRGIENHMYGHDSPHVEVPKDTRAVRLKIELLSVVVDGMETRLVFTLQASDHQSNAVLYNPTPLHLSLPHLAMQESMGVFADEYSKAILDAVKRAFQLLNP